MAEPHSLLVGDIVSHPEWPEGETRTVVGFTFFQRAVRGANGRTRIVQDHDVRFAELDEPASDGDMDDRYWAEAGLVKSNG